MRNLVLILAIAFLFNTVQAAEYRTWTGSNGKTIEAEFVSYDTDKEIVHIRLKNGKENRVRLDLFSKRDQDFVRNYGKTDNPFADTATRTNEVIQMTLHLDEYGDGFVQVERMDKPANSKFKGTPLKLQSIPQAEVLKGKDGIVQITHDFEDIDDIETVFIAQVGDNGRIDNGRWTFRREFRLPITTTIDILEQKGKDCGTINLRLGELFVLSITFKVGDSYNLAGKHEKTGERIFHEESVSLNEKYEKKFRLPIPNAKNTDRLRFDVEQKQIKSIDDAHTLLSKVKLTGLLSPWIQIGTNNPNDAPAFVKFISPKLTEESGIEKGDIIRSINGKMPENGREMFRLFAECPLGDDITVKVERRGKEMEFKIKTDK